MTRLLVVGGSGFIGRHIVTAAMKLGWDVTSLSLRPLPQPQHGGVRTLTVDLRDADALRRALPRSMPTSRFDYVVNCGGYIDHAAFASGGREQLETHLSGAVNLAQTLDRGALRAFVQFGSSDEYGGNEAPQVEIQREAPISPYAAGKLAATHFLQMLHRTEGFPAVVLRLFLTYGPGQDCKRLLPQIILGCLQDRSFATTAGAQLRDFCFVQDVVRAAFAALMRAEAAGEVINIASGEARSIRQVIESTRHRIGRGQPRFGELPYRPGENMRLYADISKARRLLGWVPEVGFDDGLDETIRSFREAQ